MAVIITFIHCMCTNTTEQCVKLVSAVWMSLFLKAQRSFLQFGLLLNRQIKYFMQQSLLCTISVPLQILFCKWRH